THIAREATALLCSSSLLFVGVQRAYGPTQVADAGDDRAGVVLRAGPVGVQADGVGVHGYLDPVHGTNRSAEDTLCLVGAPGRFPALVLGVDDDVPVVGIFQIGEGFRSDPVAAIALPPRAFPCLQHD